MEKIIENISGKNVQNIVSFLFSDIYLSDNQTQEARALAQTWKMNANQRGKNAG